MLIFLGRAPYNVCPRQALKRAIQDARKNGYIGFAGVEPEFIAMRYDDDGKPVKAIDNDPAKGIRPRRQAFGYDVEYSLDSMSFLKELIDILEELGWNLHDVVAEEDIHNLNWISIILIFFECLTGLCSCAFF